MMKQAQIVVNLLFILSVVFRVAECEFFRTRMSRAPSRRLLSYPAENRIELEARFTNSRVRNNHILDRRRISSQSTFRDKENNYHINRFNNCSSLGNSFESIVNSFMKDFRQSRQELVNIKDVLPKQNRERFCNRKIIRNNAYSPIKSLNLEHNRETDNKNLRNRIRKDRLNNRSLLRDNTLQNRNFRLTRKHVEDGANYEKTDTYKNSNQIRSRRINRNDNIIRRETLDSRIRTFPQRDRMIVQNRARKSTERNFFRVSEDNLLRENRNSLKFQIRLQPRKNYGNRKTIVEDGRLTFESESERRREGLMLRSKRELKIPYSETRRIRSNNEDSSHRKTHAFTRENIEDTIVQNRNGRGFRGRIGKMSIKIELFFQRDSRQQILQRNDVKPADLQTRSRRNLENMPRQILKLTRRTRLIRSVELNPKLTVFRINADSYNNRFVQTTRLLKERRASESRTPMKDEFSSRSSSKRINRLNSFLESKSQRDINQGQNFRENAKSYSREDRLRNARSVDKRIPSRKEVRILAQNKYYFRDSDRFLSAVRYFSRKNNDEKLYENSFLSCNDCYLRYNSLKPNVRTVTNTRRIESVRSEDSSRRELITRKTVRNSVVLQDESYRRRILTRQNRLNRRNIGSTPDNLRENIVKRKQIFSLENQMLTRTENRNNVEARRRYSNSNIQFFRATNFILVSDADSHEGSSSRKASLTLPKSIRVTLEDARYRREIRNKETLRRNSVNVNRQIIRSMEDIRFSQSFSPKQDRRNEFAFLKDFLSLSNLRITKEVSRDASRIRANRKIRSNIPVSKTLPDFDKDEIEFQSRENIPFLNKQNFANELYRHRSTSYRERNGRTSILNSNQRNLMLPLQSFTPSQKRLEKGISAADGNHLSSIENSWNKSKYDYYRTTSVLSTAMDVLLGVVIIAAITQDSNKDYFSNIKAQFNELYVSGVSWIIRA